jgi:hypothetical protein
MTAIKSDRFPLRSQNQPQPERPAEPRPDSKPSGDDIGAAFEGEIREFVRRDVAQLRRGRTDAATTPAEPAVDNVNALIWRVSGASMEEIDRVILELQGVRDMLRREGERVTREISGFASLSHAAITSMKVIADSLEQWKNGGQVRPEQRSETRTPTRNEQRPASTSAEAL